VGGGTGVRVSVATTTGEAIYVGGIEEGVAFGENHPIVEFKAATRPAAAVIKVASAVRMPGSVVQKDFFSTGSSFVDFLFVMGFLLDLRFDTGATIVYDKMDFKGLSRVSLH